MFFIGRQIFRLVINPFEWIMSDYPFETDNH